MIERRGHPSSSRQDIWNSTRKREGEVGLVLYKAIASEEKGQQTHTYNV